MYLSPRLKLLKMNKKIIISSSDNNYFFLIKELHLSLKNHGILDEYDFAILDTGLELKQKNYFKDHNVLIKSTEWNVEVPKYKILGRENLKTQVARAFLPDYFDTVSYTHLTLPTILLV